MEENNNNDKGAMESIKNVAKQEVNKAKNKVLGKVLVYVAPALGFVLLCLLGIGVVMATAFSVINFFKGLLGIDASSEVSTLQTAQTIVSIDSSGYKLNNTYSEKILADLKAQMVDIQQMGFSSEKEMKDMINDYIETEVKTMYPTIGKGKVDGLVKIQRMSAETGVVQQLTYLDYASLCSKVNSQDESALNYFSLNPSTFELCVATSKVTQYYDYDEKSDNLRKHDETKRQVTLTLHEMEYQTTLQKYATPLNYFIAMHLISANTEFMDDVIDMVNTETDIVLTFIESTHKEFVQVDYEGAITTINYTYVLAGNPPVQTKVETSRSTEYINTGNISDYPQYISDPKQYIIEKITTGGDISVTSANTWRLVSDITLVKNEMKAEVVQKDQVTRRVDINESTTLQDKIGYIEEITNHWHEFYDISIIEKEGGYDVTALIDLIKSSPDVMNNLETSASLLFYLLEDNENTQELSTVMRFILYEVTGEEYGVVELGLFFDLSTFNNVAQSRLNHLKNYLRELGNYAPVLTGDGTKYIIQDDGKGNPIVGYGIKINSYKQKFIDAGYSIDIGQEVNIEFVDAIEEDRIEIYLDLVERYNTVELTGYQEQALVSIVYDTGRLIDVLSIINAYEGYWSSENDAKFEDKDKNPDMTHDLYTQYFSTIPSSGDNGEERRKSEWTLFQTGYYDVLNEWYIGDADFPVPTVQAAGYTFPHYLQNDYPGSYGTSTIPNAGCGPTSLAMVLAGLLNDPSIDPHSVVRNIKAYWPSGSYYVAGKGSSHCIFTNNTFLYKYYGVKAETCYGNNEKALQALAQGYPVIRRRRRTYISNNTCSG